MSAGPAVSGLGDRAVLKRELRHSRPAAIARALQLRRCHARRRALRAWLHMPAQLKHSVRANTPLIMALFLLGAA